MGGCLGRSHKRAAFQLVLQPGQSCIQRRSVQAQLRAAQLHNAQLRIHAPSGAAVEACNRLLHQLHHPHDLSRGQSLGELHDLGIRGHAGEHGDPGLWGRFHNQQIPQQAFQLIEQSANVLALAVKLAEQGQSLGGIVVRTEPQQSAALLFPGNA